jgi:crossover junction endodeoxyribonuclease RusA
MSEVLPSSFPESISFEVRGLPVPQGSSRGFYIKGRGPKARGHVSITSSSKGLPAWRRIIADVAQHHAPPSLWDGPIRVDLGFSMPKPKSLREFSGRGKHRVPIQVWATKRPDLDKLTRSVLDSLTNVFFEDDSQVVLLHATKDYGVPGVKIVVGRLGTNSPTNGGTES